MHELLHVNLYPGVEDKTQVVGCLQQYPDTREAYGVVGAPGVVLVVDGDVMQCRLHHDVQQNDGHLDSNEGDSCNRTMMVVVVRVVAVAIVVVVVVVVEMMTIMMIAVAAMMMMT